MRWQDRTIWDGKVSLRLAPIWRNMDIRCCIPIELDIIAVKEDELIVVEVKTRSEDFLLSPEDAVDTKKIRRIVAAADAYVRYFNIDLPVRFDIVTLIKKETGFLIDHIEDAFYAPCR